MRYNKSVKVEEMREVDRIMVEDLGIELIQMMENAGRALAELALSRFGPARVLVPAGPGGNGGGGLVAARHLTNHGVRVTVVHSHPPERRKSVTAHQARIVQAMEIREEWASADLVIDALIGYSLAGHPRGHTADLIRRANREPLPGGPVSRQRPP